MKIAYENITLRDYQLSDVDDEVRWTNEETEWFRAEAPWMTLDKVDADELRADMRSVIDGMAEDAIRWRFELEADGQHIGMVSSHYLDENYENLPWTSINQRKNAVGNHAVRALGIEICQPEHWGKGLGAKALTALMAYYRSLGERRFALETWSGHLRMLGCARKLGFREVKRNKGAYVVDGTAYDEVILEIEC